MNILPGWTPDFGGVAAPPPAITSLAYVAHTTSTGQTINTPASIDAGDLLVLVQFSRSLGGSIPIDVTPTNFTDIPTSVSSASASPVAGVRTSAKYKIANGSEDSATITGMNGSNANNKVLIQYRANLPIASLSLAAATGSAATADPSQATISASSGTPPVLGITSFGATSAVDPRTTSITPDHAINPSTSFYVHDFIQNSSPANYTFDMDDEGTNALFGFYIHNFAP